MRFKTDKGNVKVAVVKAKSLLAPKEPTFNTLPRAVCSPDRFTISQTELTFPLKQQTGQITTVLNWIQSKSQQYKVLLGTAESRKSEVCSLRRESH